MLQNVNDLSLVSRGVKTGSPARFGPVRFWPVLNGPGRAGPTW